VMVDHLGHLLCKNDAGRRRVDNGMLSGHLPTPPTSFSRPDSPVPRNADDMVVDDLKPKIARDFDLKVSCATFASLIGL
jgi:hypothetical protein